MKDKQLPDLIHLQHAHVTQHTDNNVKSEWKVRKNITSEGLFTLPSRLTEEEVFKIIHNIRDVELTAFNVGIAHAKNLQNQLFLEKIKQIEGQVKFFADENVRLATALEKINVSEV